MCSGFHGTADTVRVARNYQAGSWGGEDACPVRNALALMRWGTTRTVSRDRQCLQYICYPLHVSHSVGVRYETFSGSPCKRLLVLCNVYVCGIVFSLLCICMRNNVYAV